MRAKFTDIALEKVDALCRKWVLERLSIFDLFGAYDDVQRPSLARPDQILLDIERCQIAHADRRHQQNLDSYGHLCPHRPSLEIPMSPGLAHQLIRELQQRENVSLVIEGPQPRPVGFSEPTSTRREAPDRK